MLGFAEGKQSCRPVPWQREGSNAAELHAALEMVKMDDFFLTMIKKKEINITGAGEAPGLAQEGVLPFLHQYQGLWRSLHFHLESHISIHRRQHFVCF